MSAQVGMVAAPCVKSIETASYKATDAMSATHEISLRPARSEDDGVCGQIIAAATLASPLPDRLPHARSLWTNSAPLPPGGRTRLIAERAGVAVGFADFDPERAHVRYLFVRPAVQGSGVGSHLLARIQDDLGRAISVHCLAVNDIAVRWYLRHGFAVSGGFLRELEDQEAVWLRLTRERPG